MADLNLRIDRDGYQPPEQPKKKVVVNEAVDPLDSFYEMFAEEITGEKREPVREVKQPRVRQQRRVQREPQPVLQEEVFVPSQPTREKNYIDNSADRLSDFLGVTGKEVQINEMDERFSLLEAEISKIRQMTKAQFPGNPGSTIVSGIGNSGDGSTQGGGAVWLWDLDDVSIGTPLNGQYPTITDGDVLKYNAGTGKWIAGEGAQANILEGGIINGNGGTANTTGNVILQATTGTNGNFEVQQASANPRFKIYGGSGNTDFLGGFVQIDRLATNFKIGQSNFTVHGRSQTDIDASTYTNAGDIFYGFSSHPQDVGTADAIQYDGRVSDGLDMVNKKYVDSAIETGGGGIGFTFKGTCDVTLPLDNAANSTVAEAEGNFYINVTGGTAYNSGTTAQNWKGIGGLAISADQLIIWSESSDRWFAGAVENDTTFVKVDGSNPMTGTLNIAPSSDTEGLIIKDGSTANITLFKGGTAQFNNDITASANILCGGNINPSTTASSSIGSTSKRFKEAYINAIETQNQSVMAEVIPKTTTTNFGASGTPWNVGYFKQVNTTTTSYMSTLLPKTNGGFSLGSSGQRWNTLFGNSINLDTGFTNSGTMTQTGDATISRLTVSLNAQFNTNIETNANFVSTRASGKLQFDSNSDYGEIDVAGKKSKKLYFYATDDSGSGGGTLNRCFTIAYEEIESVRPLKVNNVRYENLTGLSQLVGDVQVGTMAMFNGIMYYYGLSGGNPRWFAMNTVNLNPPN